jgi:hypothetical protein
MNTLWTQDYQNKKAVAILQEYSAKKYWRKREFVEAETKARLGILDDEAVPAVPAVDVASTPTTPETPTATPTTAAPTQAPVAPTTETTISPETSSSSNK